MGVEMPYTLGSAAYVIGITVNGGVLTLVWGG